MKRFIIFCLMFVLSSTGLPEAQAGATSSTVEGNILALREKISLQMEKVRQSREQADGQIALARIRVADQLSRAESSLQLQIETLDRLREQLRDQIAQTDSTIEQLKSDRSTLLDKAVSDVEDQIKQTNDLIDQTRVVKDSFEKESCVQSSATSPTTSAQTPTPAAEDTSTGNSGFQTDIFPVMPADSG